jgi:hypothetical protein
MSTICESQLVGATTVLVGTKGFQSKSLWCNVQTSSEDFDCVHLSALNVDPKPCCEPEVIVAFPSYKLARKRKKGYELNCHFQDNLAAKLPWAKAIIGVDSKITNVCCKVHSI